MPSPTPLTLHVEQGISQGTSFDSGRLKHVTIGRTRTNRFQIKDETISQKHMSIDWVNDAWMAQDLGSSNGTTVNGVNIGVKTPYKIYTDDLLRIGVDTRIRIVLHDGSAPRKLGTGLQPLLEVKEEEEVEEKTAAAVQEVEEKTAAVQEKTDSSERRQLDEEFKVHGNLRTPATACVAAIVGRIESLKAENIGLSERLEEEEEEEVEEVAPKPSSSLRHGSSLRREITLREWLRQEMVRIPTILHERAEATIREMEIHAGQLKCTLQISGKFQRIC